MKNTVSGFLALLLTAVLLVSPVFAENDLINDIPPTNEYYIWMGMEGDSPIKWHIIGATGYEYLLMSADLIGSKMNWSDAMDFVRYEAIYEISRRPNRTRSYGRTSLQMTITITVQAPAVRTTCPISCSSCH